MTGAVAAALLVTNHAAAQTFEKTTPWVPRGFSTFSGDIDALFNWILLITCATGIGVFAFLIYFLIKYRYRPGRQAKFTHGSSKLELVWTIIPTLILAITAAVSQATWGKIKSIDAMPDPATDPNVIEVRVVARQFGWIFWYPGKDGKFGHRSKSLVPDGAQQPDDLIGLDREGDPAAKDDVLLNQLFVPVKRKILLHVTSVDVIHSFYIPSMRVKQDTMPGLWTPVWFEATKQSREVVGVTTQQFLFGDRPDPRPFDVVCAELCGLGHYGMRADLYVVTEEEYNTYIGTLMEEQAAADDGF